jgi:Hsp70 protein
VQAGREWRSLISPGDIILVCDVGGGTADFSLIAVTDSSGTLELERISVGEHILLGGDNMDLALAYTLQAKLEAEGRSIDSWQFLALVHAASKAKVALFDADSLPEVPIAVPSRGSSLLARTVSTALERATLEQIVLDGFFAKTTISDLPQEARRIGLQEFGLPFAADPVISKHLAHFLCRSRANVSSSQSLSTLVGGPLGSTEFVMPTAVLFNGGVFKSGPIRSRVLELLTSWNDGKPVRERRGIELDLAVAKGASFYGRTRVTQKVFGSRPEQRARIILASRARCQPAAPFVLSSRALADTAHVSGQGPGHDTELRAATCKVDDFGAPDCGSSYDNKENLAPAFFAQIVKKYEGTRLGRQELNAELLEDTPGALWTHGIIDASRVSHVSDLTRIVVAIDPAVTSGEEADETGIVVVGKDNNGHGYVLADCSGRYQPIEWAKIAIAAYRGASRGPDRPGGDDCLITLVRCRLTG